MIAGGVKLLEESGVDYTEAMERFAGNASLYERLILKFLNDPHYENLQKALAENNIDQAFREAHSLKGVAGNLSFTALYAAASEVNEALRAENTTSAVELMAPLREAHASVTAALIQIQG